MKLSCVAVRLRRRESYLQRPSFDSAGGIRIGMRGEWRATNGAKRLACFCRVPSFSYLDRLVGPRCRPVHGRCAHLSASLYSFILMSCITNIHQGTWSYPGPAIKCPLHRTFFSIASFLQLCSSLPS